MKTRKYKVDEWVWYSPLINENTAEVPSYAYKALILSICEQEDFYDYRIYIEETAKFKSAREENLLNMEK